MSYGMCGILSTSENPDPNSAIRHHDSSEIFQLKMYGFEHIQRLQIISRLVSLVLTGSMVLHRNTELPSSGFSFSETMEADSGRKTRF